MTRDEQITALMPFADQIAAQILHTRGIPWRHLDDARSDGYYGIVKAVQAYNSDLGPLRPYVERRIRGEIIDGFRSRTKCRTEMKIEDDGSVTRQVHHRGIPTLSLEASMDARGDYLPDPVDHFDAVEIRIMLESVTDKLPSDQREVLTDFYIDGKSLAEIARKMGVTRWYAQEALHKAESKAQRIAGVTAQNIMKNRPLP